jgi:VWFA-related protein
MFLMRRLPLLIIAAAALRGQQDPLVFRAGAALVRVDAQVLEGGRPLAGLTAADFVVRDEGVPQFLVDFGRESVPLRLLLVLDNSGSMRRLAVEMAATAGRAIAHLGPEDEVGLLVFARRSKLLLEFTRDDSGPARMLRQAPLEDGLGSGSEINAALLDAARVVAGGAAPSMRRAVLILTDNGGLSYQVSNASVVEALSGAGAVLNAIVSASARPPEPSQNPDFIPHDVFLLARETGGEVLRADRASERFLEMLERIRARYAFSYKAPAAAPGSFRRIRVELAPEARRRYPQAEVRARAGYTTAPLR